MLKEGTLRSSWYIASDSPEAQGPYAGSIILLECADEEEARNQVDRFPLVQKNFVSVDLLPLLPFDAFEFLFGDAEKEDVT